MLLTSALIAFLLACGTALGQQFSADIDYPVPAMPADGWVPAWFTIKNLSNSTQRYQVQTVETWSGARTRVAAERVIKPREDARGIIYVFAGNRQSNTSSLVIVRCGDLPASSSGALRMGRSVVAVTGKRGTVSARIEQLDPILTKDMRDMQKGPQATDVIIEEHKDASRLPDSWLGYDLLQAMVIEDFPYAALSGAQEDAIVQWVENGGTLLVFPGKLGQALQSSLLRQLASIQTQGAETLGAAPPELGAFSGSVTRWNFTIGRAQHLAWAEVAACGLGKVVVFKYDLLGSLAQWDGLGQLLQRTCMIAPRTAAPMPLNVSWAGREGKLLKPPTVAAILGVYLLVLGPINYVFLRRRKKLVLMPLSITVIALAFTFAIIIFGYLWKGSSNELKEISVVRTLPDRTTAYATSQIGLYCSSNRKFELDFPSTAAVRKIGDSNESQYDDAPMDLVDTGQGVYRAGFQSMMWSAYRLEARAPLPQFGNLRIAQENDATVVVNATASDVESCWVRQQTPDGRTSWHDVGRVPRGGKAVVGKASPRPPLGDLLAVAAVERGSIVVAKSASDTSAISYKLRTGRAQKMQCDTFITGAAAPLAAPSSR